MVWRIIKTRVYGKEGKEKRGEEEEGYEENRKRNINVMEHGERGGGVRKSSNGPEARPGDACHWLLPLAMDRTK